MDPWSEENLEYDTADPGWHMGQLVEVWLAGQQWTAEVMGKVVEPDGSWGYELTIVKGG